MYQKKKTDLLIVGSGCAGLYCALQLPKEKQILIITKSNVENSDSYLAQGGICMLKNDEDYESYYEDTMRAGHYENDPESVEIMIRSSQNVVEDLLSYGVDFKRDENGQLAFTREGAHSDARILYHEDITGKEITSHLYEEVLKRENVTIMEHTSMVDIIEKENHCYGVIARDENSELLVIEADYTLWATGGVGGLYQYSTNFRHLTGDALAVGLKHHVQMKNINYVQIHPTTLYTETQEDRSFLISESVRGEGAKLYDQNMNRFVDELLPRDLLTKEIHKQMEKDHSKFVWEDLRTIPEDELKTHFPNIVEHCRKMGYDVTRECIPVVPAQHYFMGGVKVDHNSATSMEHLYAIGETACNGVHGKNRLASNSLLESLVFAKRAAGEIDEFSKEEMENAERENYIREDVEQIIESLDWSLYEDMPKLEELYRSLVLEEMERQQNLDEARSREEKREAKSVQISEKAGNTITCRRAKVS